MSDFIARLFFLLIVVSCTNGYRYFDCRTIIEYQNDSFEGVLFKIGHEFEYDDEWIDLYKRSDRSDLFKYIFDYPKIIVLVEDRIIKNDSIKQFAYYKINKYYRQIEIDKVYENYTEVSVNFIIRTESLNKNEFLKMPITVSNIKDNFTWKFRLDNKLVIENK